MSSLYTKSLKIRDRKSKKNRQYDGQTKKDIATNNHLQNITQKTKDWAIWTPLKIGDEFIYSGRVSSSCDKDISRTTMCSQLSYITYNIKIGLWCLMSLSTIFQLYCASQFYWWRKPQYRRKPQSDRKSLIN